ncbi:MAG: glutaminase, partial [Flavobacteriales bacterium]
MSFKESIEKVSDSVRFSIQSIFSLTLANKLLAEKMWMRVDAEPSGTRFDSLLLLEMNYG